MAKQREMIEPREYMSHQWYRRIGAHRYRFRFNPKPEIGPGAFEVTAHRAIARRQWELVHMIVIKGSGD